MRAGHPDAAVETETTALVPPLVPDPGSPAEALARELTGANETTTIAFATEAGLFQAAGIPAVICGPGSIDVAHQPERIHHPRPARRRRRLSRPFVDLGE